MIRLKLQRVALLMGCVFYSALSSVAAQSFSQWGNLKPGPYAVGFKVIHTFDYSRGYRPKVDYKGQPFVGETARPMRITLWYPASPARGAQPMLYREYVLERETELGAKTLAPEQEANFIKAFAASIRGAASLIDGKLVKLFPDDLPEERVKRMMTTPTAAFRNAAPVKGRFPVVVYMGVTEEHSVLFEYLASQGYIVASIPDIGTSPAYYRVTGTSEPDPALRQQAKADDLSFLLGYVRALPNADHSKVAAFGMANGFQPSLQLQTKRATLNALVLQGSVPSGLTKDEIARLRIPLLGIVPSDVLAMSPDAPARFEKSLQSIPYADRYIVHLNRVGHPELAAYRRAGNPEQSAEDKPYEIMANYMLNFLNANLKQEAAARSFLQRAPEANGIERGQVTTQTLPALPPVPTEEEFLALLQGQPDLAELKRTYQEIKRRQPDYQLFSEQAVPVLTLLVQRRRNYQESIEVLKLVLDSYPDALTAHSSIADAYVQAGEKESAIRHFETALGLLGKNSTLTPQQKERLQNNLQQRLSGLKQGK